MVGVAADADGLLLIRCGAARVTTPAVSAPTVTVGCLAGLDPETLAAAAATMEHGRLQLERSYCAACPVAGIEQVDAALRAGVRLAASVAPAVEVTDEVVEPGGASSPPARITSRRFSRRALLKPVPRAAVPDATPRAMLLAVAPRAPLPTLEVSSACTACEACARVCPTGALEWSNGPSGPELRATTTSCVECRECVRVCAEDAVRLAGRRPGPHTPTVLVRVATRACSRCEALLAPGEDTLCSRCAGRRSLLDDVWAQLSPGPRTPR